MKGFKMSHKGGKSGHDFPSGFGFTGSSGAVRSVRGYTQKSPIKKAGGGAVFTPGLMGRAAPARVAPAPPPRPQVAGPQPMRGVAFKKGGKVSHSAGCSCPMCSGGMMKKAEGGRVGTALVGQHDNPRKFSENMEWDDYKKGGQAKMKIRVKKGALHSALGIKQGKKIPSSALTAAAKSDSPLMRKRAVFAQNAREWNHR